MSLPGPTLCSTQPKVPLYDAAYEEMCVSSWSVSTASSDQTGGVTSDGYSNFSSIPRLTAICAFKYLVKF